LGKSFNAHFALNSTATLSPAADAYVRDGTYASTNYGTSSIMDVKNDIANYARKAMLKFDLSSISGTITSAVLKLTPTSVGTTGMSHVLYQSPLENWTDGSLTWNAVPASGAQLATWAVPAVNTPVQVDLSSAANGALSGSKVLSMEIDAAANY